MKGKRLFWASIIVVELVLVYVLWRPGRQHFARPAHKTASVPAVTNPPETETATNPAPAPPAAPKAAVPKAATPKANETKAARGPATGKQVAKAVPRRGAVPASKNPLIAMAPHKPSPIPHLTAPAPGKPPAVNAGLISREPVAVKKPAPPPLSPLESFWCQMSTIDSNCNCKGTDQRAANTPTQYPRSTP